MGEEDKMTLRGKMDSGTFTQTKMYIKPLLKLLKKNTMSDDIRDSLSSMVKYIKADIKPQAQEEVEQGAEEIRRGPEVNRRSEEELIEAEERHDPANRWGGKKIFNRQ